jgi:hypothetical protein
MVYVYLSKVVHIIDVERGWSGANEHYTQLNSNLNYYCIKIIDSQIKWIFLIR